MAATGVGDGGLLFRGVFEGSISGFDLEVDRRPYHKNCTCALHSSSRPSTCSHHKPSKVSYPIKRSWSEGSFAFYPVDPSINNPSPSPSPSSSSSAVDHKGTPVIPRASSSSTLFEFFS